MKLILKEYLGSLKEKDELDSLLLDLLLLNGFSTNNVPKTGERQYGVDIFADKDDQAYLFVVKQQDLTRKTWDSDQNSVRPSLNEIMDVFVPALLPKKFHGTPINVIVVTNGNMSDAVRPNWESFCRENEVRNERHYKYEFWGIDHLVDMTFSSAFNETLFPKKMQSNLRKTLYFLDENDVSSKYYESLINLCFESLDSCVEGSRKKQIRHFSSFYMLINLVIHWAHEHERNKIAIQVSEYAIIKYWRFLLVHDLFEKDFYIDNLISLLELYERCNNKFCSIISSVVERKCELPFINVLEQRILLYEVIGFLSSYGYYLSSLGWPNHQNIADYLIDILNENQNYKYPLYDKNICELSILLLFLYSVNRKQDAIALVGAIISGLMINHIQHKKTPSQDDSYEEALAIEFGKDTKPFLASVLYGGFLEWCCILGLKDDYDRLKDYLKNQFDNITAQTWHINFNEESELYAEDAVFKIGVSQAFDLSLDFKNQTDIIHHPALSSETDEFSFFKYSFPAVALITCRYYGYPVLPEFWRTKELLDYSVI